MSYQYDKYQKDNSLQSSFSIHFAISPTISFCHHGYKKQH